MFRSMSFPSWFKVAVFALLGAGVRVEAVERPPIVGIANFVVRVKDVGESVKFYTEVLGYEQVFTHRRSGIPAGIAVFKVNDRQYIEIAPTLASESDDKLIQIGFETKNARKLRDFLAAKGVAVPAKAGKDEDGNLSFSVKDPEGHQVEFVEYRPKSLHSRSFGKALSERRISDHMLHVGIHVKDPDLQDKFYKDILGFRFQWKGGPQNDRVDWISLMVPDGNNWIEYMVSRGTPTPAQLGVWHHVCVGTLDMAGLYRKVLDRGHKPRREPNIARDGRLLLQLYDQHNTRTEVMVRKPVEKPCCSENLDPYTK